MLFNFRLKKVSCWSALLEGYLYFLLARQQDWKTFDKEMHIYCYEKEGRESVDHREKV